VKITKFITVILTLSLLALPAVYASIESEEGSKQLTKEMPKEGGPDEAMMAQWQAYMTPGENHRNLDKFVGNWNHKVQIWMSKDAKPEESMGISEVKWILGGKFLQHETKGDYNGQPFEGLGIIGFDNIRNEYNSVWLDSMGTGMMQANGQFNAGTLEFTESGEFSCPITNDTKLYRGVTKFADDDNYTYEFFTMDEEGNEYRHMLIAYTREK